MGLPCDLDDPFSPQKNYNTIIKEKRKKNINFGNEEEIWEIGRAILFFYIKKSLHVACVISGLGIK